ncbi:MAG: hypothetical protein ACLS6G_10190 [Christensenellales bacterium]
MDAQALYTRAQDYVVRLTQVEMAFAHSSALSESGRAPRRSSPCWRRSCRKRRTASTISCAAASFARRRRRSTRRRC